MKARGSRAEVMHGNAKRTSGGLRKKDLKYNKQRRIVSRKMSRRAKKDNRLGKAGYETKKGVFGSFKNGKRVSGRRSRRRSRRRQRGGSTLGELEVVERDAFLKRGKAREEQRSSGRSKYAVKTPSAKKQQLAIEDRHAPLAIKNI